MERYTEGGEEGEAVGGKRGEGRGGRKGRGEERTEKITGGIYHFSLIFFFLFFLLLLQILLRVLYLSVDPYMR